MKNLHKKALALLLTVMICLGVCPSFADDRTADTYYYGGTGQDTVYDVTPLPNGNLLLNGYTQLGRADQAQLKGGGHPTRAWLVCLTPDGSILWEAIDETEGTTRYVTPIVTTAGEIAVLFYNSPSQVNTELAIHFFSLEGELLRKISLPLEAGLVEGRMTDGFVFYDWEKGFTVAELNGNLRALEVAKEERIIGFGTAAMVPYDDGWVIAGHTQSENRIQMVACFDANGKRVWSFTTPELSSGFFYGPCLQNDGTLLFNWCKANAETGDVLESRMICLDKNGQLLWEKPIPKEISGPFAITDEGWVFARHWMEKTYTFIQFTLVGFDGQLQKQWQAEKRREMFYGASMFTWNGEAWFHTDTERQSNRVNDRQDEMELQDVMLIRVEDCKPVEQ